MNSKKLSLGGSFLAMLLLGLSCISDVAAQYRTTAPPDSDRLVISESVSLSEQVSRLGGKFYPYTNLYTNWTIGLNLPKSSYSFNFGAGGRLSDTGTRCVPGSTTIGLPGSPRCGSRLQADVYTTLLNAFDFASVHQLAPKWSLTITDSFFYYPNIQRYGDLLQFNSGVNGQVSNLGSLRNFKISPFGATSSKRPGSDAGTLALTSPIAPGGYGHYPGVGGYYGSYYPVFVGSLTNDFSATIDHPLNSKSTLDFTYDNSYLNYKSFGSFKSQSFTAQYNHQYSRKGTYYVSYSIGRYAFKEPNVPAEPVPAEPAALEKATLANRVGLNALNPTEKPATNDETNNQPYKPGFTHTISVGTSYQLTPDILLDFSIGPSVTTSSEGTTPYLNFSTMVAISKNFKKTSVSAEYFRYVGSGFGIGTVALTQGASLSLSRPVLKRVDLNLSATYFHFNDIFGEFTDSSCDPPNSTNCTPATGRPKIPNITGLILTTNMTVRLTKHVNTNLGFTYFHGNTPGRLNPLLIPGGYFPFGGGSIYNTISFDRSIGHNLSAFVTYSYLSAGLSRSGGSNSHNVSIGLTHTNPSIFRIGRRK